jgi:hypothetical protein
MPVTQRIILECHIVSHVIIFNQNKLNTRVSYVINVDVSRLLRHMQEAGVPRVYLLLHSNGDLRNSTVADQLSMFATCERFPWKAPTLPS